MDFTSKEIIKLDEEQGIILDEQSLERILNKPEIRDRYICVVSVAGEFRGGKSFLLNFLIRFLHASKNIHRLNARDWMDPDLGPLKGFISAPGAQRCTTGIQLWPEIFCTSLPTKEEIAILLIDTQGSFDHQSHVADCAKIFALSTLISSTQIYNLSRNIKQYDLDHLRCFTSYGGLLSKTESGSFQNLVFLVRDWPYPFEKPYGVAGGAVLLDEVLSSKNKEVRDHLDNITKSFNEINCFLMPHPGHIVESPKFQGNLNDVDEHFKTHVRDFVTMILAPGNLLLKKIDGEKITAGQLTAYLKEYCKLLQGNDIPGVQAVAQANIEAQHKIAAAESLKIYKKRMYFDCTAGATCYSVSAFYNFHSRFKSQALENYKSVRKTFDREVYHKYLHVLDKNIETEFKMYKKINDEKLKKNEDMKKKIEEQNRMATDGPSTSGLSTDTIATIGTAVAVVGAAAAAAFFVFKAFSGGKGKDQ